MTVRAPLFVVMLAAATAASAQTTPTVTIDMSNYRFTPAALHLAAGKPIVLKFTNSTEMTHDFTAKDFFASARLMSGSAEGGKITLPGGATASVTVIPARGTYKVRCTRLFHTMRGMVGSIVVD